MVLFDEQSNTASCTAAPDYVLEQTCNWDNDGGCHEDGQNCDTGTDSADCCDPANIDPATGLHDPEDAWGALWSTRPDRPAIDCSGVISCTAPADGDTSCAEAYCKFTPDAAGTTTGTCAKATQVECDAAFTADSDGTTCASLGCSYEADTTVECPAGGGKVNVPGYTGLLLCPAYDELCGADMRAHDWAADLANATALRFKGLTPSIGSSAGGTEITIYGRGFTDDLEVDIGGLPATVVAVTSGGTAAQVIAPADHGNDGAKDVVVRNRQAHDVGFSAFESAHDHPVNLKDNAVHLVPGDNATYAGTIDLQTSHTWHQVFFSADRAGATVYFSVYLFYAGMDSQGEECHGPAGTDTDTSPCMGAVLDGGSYVANKQICEAVDQSCSFADGHSFSAHVESVGACSAAPPAAGMSNDIQQEKYDCSLLSDGDCQAAGCNFASAEKFVLTLADGPHDSSTEYGGAFQLLVREGELPTRRHNEATLPDLVEVASHGTIEYFLTDCEGTVGGTAVMDECGVCGGTNHWDGDGRWSGVAACQHHNCGTTNYLETAGHTTSCFDWMQLRGFDCFTTDGDAWAYFSSTQKQCVDAGTTDTACSTAVALDTNTTETECVAAGCEYSDPSEYYMPGRCSRYCAILGPEIDRLSSPCDSIMPPQGSNTCEDELALGGLNAGLCDGSCGFCASVRSCAIPADSVTADSDPPPADGTIDGACVADAELVHGGSTCDVTCDAGFIADGPQPECDDGTFVTGAVVCRAAGPCDGADCGVGAICTDDGTDYTCSCDTANGYTGADYVNAAAMCTHPVTACPAGEQICGDVCCECVAETFSPAADSQPCRAYTYCPDGVETAGTLTSDQVCQTAAVAACPAGEEPCGAVCCVCPANMWNNYTALEACVAHSHCPGGIDTAGTTTSDNVCHPEVQAVDCVGGWGSWSDCDANCGDGTEARTYVVTTYATGGGTDCSRSDGYVQTQVCNVPAGGTCDDGNAESMDDVCLAAPADTCEGTVQLAAALALALPDITDIVLPAVDATVAEIDAMPIAGVVKTSLAAALAGVVEADITISGISTQGDAGRRRLQTAGALTVDYVIALPPAAAAAAKTASATMTVPDIVIPAAATVANVAVTVASADIVAEPLVSYAYGETLATCPTDCGTAASTPANTYTCIADGVAEADTTNCVAKIGPVPSSTRTCAAADACPVLCTVDQSVTASHACAPCATGETRAAGDDPAGAATACDAPAAAVVLGAKTSAAPAAAAPLTALVGALLVVAQL